MNSGFVQTEVSTGANADDKAFFANALANPPIPADATLAQARDVLDACVRLSPPAKLRGEQYRPLRRLERRRLRHAGRSRDPPCGQTGSGGYRGSWRLD